MKFKLLCTESLQIFQYTISSVSRQCLAWSSQLPAVQVGLESSHLIRPWFSPRGNQHSASPHSSRFSVRSSTRLWYQFNSFGKDVIPVLRNSSLFKFSRTFKACGCRMIWLLLFREILSKEGRPYHMSRRISMMSLSARYNVFKLKSDANALECITCIWFWPRYRASRELISCHMSLRISVKWFPFSHSLVQDFNRKNVAGSISRISLLLRSSHFSPLNP